MTARQSRGLLTRRVLHVAFDYTVYRKDGTIVHIIKEGYFKPGTPIDKTMVALGKGLPGVQVDVKGLTYEIERRALDYNTFGQKSEKVED